MGLRPQSFTVCSETGDVMNFYQLTYFIEAVKSGSMNRAARQLSVNPATLAIALNNLEEEVGCSLLERSHKGIFLTREGEDFFEDAAKILDIQARWKNRKQHPLPGFFDVNMLCIPVIYNAVSADMCWKMAEAMPNINLIPHERYVSEIHNAIIKRWPELIIVSCPRGEEESVTVMADRMGLNHRILLEDTWKIFMRKDNPYAEAGSISLQTLRTMKGVVSSYHLYNYNNLQAYDFNNVIYLYRQRAALHCVAYSDRFTVQPSIARFDTYITSNLVKMLDIADTTFYLEYILLWPKAITENRLYKYAVEFITEYFYKLKDN